MKDVVESKTRDQLIAERLTDNPDAMEHIFNHVAQGGSLVELAKMWDIPYWAIAAYTSQEGRDKVLNRAMVLRSEYWIEKLKWIIQQLSESNIQDLYDENGAILNPKDMPRTLAACVQPIEVFEEFDYMDGQKIKIGETKKVKFWNKDKNLEMLAKIYGLFVV